jgi:hypothetical protein
VVIGLCGFASGCRVINNDLLFADTVDAATSTDAPVNLQLPTAAGQLVISEFMAQPSTGNAGEYIEIYNPGPNTYDLLGCEVSDNDPDRGHIVSANVLVMPGRYVTLAYGDAAAAGFSPDYSYAGTFKLGSQDIVALKCGGVTIDVVDYSAVGAFPVTDRYSMTLAPGKLDAVANDTPANWCSAAYREYHPGDFGTPGGANQACGAQRPSVTGSLVITEIQSKANGNLGEYVEIYNPSTTTTFDLLDCTIGDSDTANPHTIAKSLVFAPGAYVTLGYSDSASEGFALDYSYAAGFKLGGTDVVHVICGGVDIDTVSYDELATVPWPVMDGKSLNLKPTALTAVMNDSVSNWCASTVNQYTTGIYGTPGAANQTCP